MVAIIMRLVRRPALYAPRVSDRQVAPASHTLIFSYLKHSIFLRPALFVSIVLSGDCHRG